MLARKDGTTLFVIVKKRVRILVHPLFYGCFCIQAQNAKNADIRIIVLMY